MIGRKFSDPSISAKKAGWPFKISPGENDDIEINIPFYPNKLKPEEVSGEILKYLINVGNSYLRQDQRTNHVVISVPARFNNAQREATLRAAEYAGLNVLRLVNEPTAAAIAFVLNSERFNTKRLILIFDFGGGTLDVSLVEAQNLTFTVKAVDGDINLGGRDIDQNIMDYVLKQTHKEHLKNNPKMMSRLRRGCEEAKIELSNNQETEIFIEGSEDIEYTLTRNEFNDINRSLFDRLTKPITRVLDAVGKSKRAVDDIILVGGSSYIPKVREIVKNYFGKDPYRNIDPQDAIASGAAIIAQKFVGGNEFKDIVDLKFQDVCPLSLGVRIVGDEMSTVIKHDTVIPTYKTETYYTTLNWQTKIDFGVYEGERLDSNANTFLGNFSLSGIPRAEAREIPVNVTFHLNENGILEVTAEAGSGTNHTQNTIIITKCSSYNPDEVNKAKTKGMQNQETDKRVVEKRKNTELLMCLFLNILSYISEYEADVTLHLGAYEVDRIKAEVNEKLKKVERLASPTAINEQKAIYREKFKSYIRNTGKTPRCLRDN
ncbi:78 kDa glucose-regulated protein [Histomonas meleagridis]|uniref:78 kDa glucose-regulated protein n=1 Tax=Histomonas meleagridis TaxID=135588 RepID=UPI0035595E0C|nr:78 kDa glucose-regulated protein [Histomonas meleagridis]KAH0804399.1 78 kDa glucose-regulated protein [Histomonas meleagridis]